MDWKLILWSISMLWWVYVIWYIIKFGLPSTWSSTFYTIKNRYGKHIGYALLGMEFIYCLPLIPIVIERSGLMALALVGVAFLATASDYRRDVLSLTVHMVGAIGSVILALLLFGILYNLWLFTIPFAILIILLSTEKIKLKNYTTWIETATMLAGHIIILIKDVLQY